MEDIKCQSCSTENDYELTKSGPHIKATCKSCGKYIKFVRQDIEIEEIDLCERALKSKNGLMKSRPTSLF